MWYYLGRFGEALRWPLYGGCEGGILIGRKFYLDTQVGLFVWEILIG